MASDVLCALFEAQVKGVRLNEFTRDVCVFGTPVLFRRNPTNLHDKYCVDVLVRGHLLGHIARGATGVVLSVLLRLPYRING